jgi:hypothetical protein
MEDWKDVVLFPLRIAGAFMKISGRITIGAVGFVLMGAGLLAISPLHFPLYVGLPVIVIGLLLLVRAVF